MMAGAVRGGVFILPATDQTGRIILQLTNQIRVGK